MRAGGKSNPSPTACASEREVELEWEWAGESAGAVLARVAGREGVEVWVRGGGGSWEVVRETEGEVLDGLEGLRVRWARLSWSSWSLMYCAPKRGED